MTGREGWEDAEGEIEPKSKGGMKAAEMKRAAEFERLECDGGR